MENTLVGGETKFTSTVQLVIYRERAVELNNRREIA